MSLSARSLGARANFCRLKRKPHRVYVTTSLPGIWKQMIVAAVARKTLEKSACHFTPQHLLGLYRWHSSESDTTGLRFAFTGKITGHEAGRKLDDGIMQTLWLSPEQIRATRMRHRSPLILRCVEDHIAGKRYPLDLLVHYD